MKKRDKKQLLPGIVVAVAISFLVFLYAPVDLYCSIYPSSGLISEF